MPTPASSWTKEKLRKEYLVQEAKALGLEEDLRSANGRIQVLEGQLRIAQNGAMNMGRANQALERMISRLQEQIGSLVWCINELTRKLPEVRALRGELVGEKIARAAKEESDAAPSL